MLPCLVHVWWTFLLIMLLGVYTSLSSRMLTFAFIFIITVLWLYLFIIFLIWRFVLVFLNAIIGIFGWFHNNMFYLNLVFFQNFSILPFMEFRCFDVQTIVFVEISVLRIKWLLALLSQNCVLQVFNLVLRNFQSTSLWSLYQQQNIIVRFITIVIGCSLTLLVEIDVDKVLLMDIPEIFERLSFLKPISQTFHLFDASI